MPLRQIQKWPRFWDIGGPTFGPVKYVKEVSHVQHMHANSILIHTNFSPKLMITWLKPDRTNESGPKVSFRTIHGQKTGSKNAADSGLQPSARPDFCQRPSVRFWRIWVSFWRSKGWFGFLKKKIITCPAVSISWNDKGSSSTVKCTKILNYRNDTRNRCHQFLSSKINSLWLSTLCHQNPKNFWNPEYFDSRTSISMWSLFHLWSMDFRFQFYSSNGATARFRF